MKNKNEIIKNHLNISTFKENLLKQQESLIEFYNNIDQNNNIILNNDSNYYTNNIFNIKGNYENITNSNIFNIRLMQTKENLAKLSKIKWPNTDICESILELKGSVNKINIIFLILGRKNFNWRNI